MYFRIKGKNNLVLLYIKEGYGIIISEWIKSKEGEKINLVEKLGEFYWYIDERNNMAKAARLSYRSIWRCIGSLMEYGDIMKKLPRWLEVHHKFMHYCNTEETLTVVSYEKHNYFHNVTSNRKSRRRSKVIGSTTDFKIWIDNLEKINQRFANKEM